jgi:hypothetical protein
VLLQPLSSIPAAKRSSRQAAAAMAESGEHKAPPGMFLLEVSGDGRTSPNWTEYEVMVPGVLSGKFVGDICLEDVLLNQDDGKRVLDPGSQLRWIADAPVGEQRDEDLYKEQVKKFRAWKRANSQAHVLVMNSCDPSLRQACVQRLIAHELWEYLRERFAGETLTSLPALWTRLLTLQLRDFNGVSDFLTAIGKLEAELERAGQQVPTAAVAGAILVGMGDRFATTREIVLALPADQQTKEVYATRFLEAEKNAQLTAEMNAMYISRGGAPPARQGAGGAAPGGGFKVCGYIRKLQGKGRFAAPGKKCTRRHPPGELCWSKADDQWLQANPGKGPGDLPIRNPRLLQMQQNQQQAAVMQAGQQQTG